MLLFVQKQTNPSRLFDVIALLTATLSLSIAHPTDTVSPNNSPPLTRVTSNHVTPTGSRRASHDFSSETIPSAVPPILPKPQILPSSSSTNPFINRAKSHDVLPTTSAAGATPATFRTKAVPAPLVPQPIIPPLPPRKSATALSVEEKGRPPPPPPRHSSIALFKLADRFEIPDLVKQCVTEAYNHFSRERRELPDGDYLGVAIRVLGREHALVQLFLDCLVDSKARLEQWGWDSTTIQALSKDFWIEMAKKLAYENHRGRREPWYKRGVEYYTSMVGETTAMTEEGTAA